MSFSDAANKISNALYYYVNSTNEMQLVRVIKKRSLYLEKIIFPQQRILFEAMPEAKLEIYSGQADKIRITQTINCNNLKSD